MSDPTFGANRKRNAVICKLADEQRLSYAVIAEMIGVSRNAVAGVVFRHRHPFEARNHNNMNKTGTGWHPSSYYPEKTAWNSR